MNMRPILMSATNKPPHKDLELVNVYIKECFSKRKTIIKKIKIVSTLKPQNAVDKYRTVLNTDLSNITLSLKLLRQYLYEIKLSDWLDHLSEDLEKALQRRADIKSQKNDN
jgi:hypothetical protein